MNMLTHISVLEVISVLLIALLLGSYLGAIHPLGDSLAVFRPELSLIAVIFALIALRKRRGRWAAMGGILGFVSLGIVGLHFINGNDAANATFSHYQKNLLFKNPDLAPVIADIRLVQPDFVTLQEVSQRNLPILAALSADYPAQEFCRFARVGGTAVLSRWPFVPGQSYCSEGQGIVAIQVETRAGRFWIVSLHLHWPWPFQQAFHVEHMLPELQALVGPKIIGGDFNMVRWSSAVREIASVSGTTPAGAARMTYTQFDWVKPLAIDHVLIPENASGHSETRPELGSDHRGLVVRFSFGS